jgi:hypothetical protein
MTLCVVSTGCLYDRSANRFQSTTPPCPVSHPAASAFGSNGIAAAPTTAGGDELAQSFVAPKTFKAGLARLKLTRAGMPGGELRVSIQGSSGSDANAQPDGVSKASGSFTVTSQSAAQGNISTSPEGGFIEFKLSAPAELKPAELKKDARYWLLVQASYALSDLHVVKWVSGLGDVDPTGFGLEETAVTNSWRALPQQDFLYQVCEE